MTQSAMEKKRAYWSAQVGKQVSATNYRSAVAAGRLVSVQSGVWGYGGDSVALELDVKDDRGLRFWPADLCAVAEAAAGPH